MSCNNWERGTLVIPRDQWVAFRTGLIKEHNRLQLEALDLAKKMLAGIKQECKTLDNSFQIQNVAEAWWRKDGPRTPKKWYGAYSSTGGHPDEELFYPAFDLIWNYAKSCLRTPKKKQLKIHPVSKSCCLDYGEVEIHLDNKTRTVTWVVHENNRAVERANELPIAAKLWSLLGNITWKRGSGGQIIGNDEYNQEGYEHGGGANYVTREYGPNKKDKVRLR